LLFALAVMLLPEAVSGQDMPKDEYYTYVPLSYTRPVRQAAGTAALNLYGDVDDPSYVDRDPVDGIDDRRHQVLLRMGVKFAPYLVLNTTAVPMDWRKFMDGRSSFPLFVDTWNQAVEGGELMREEQVDWLALPGAPCPDAPDAAQRSNIDDCRLLSLLEEFDPEDPQSEYYQTLAIDPQVDPFKVLYWNFPGHDEASWKAEFEDPISQELPQRYWSFPKTYLHPFIEEVRDASGELLGYELVLQYWFFYSFNDGGNNHEGDWEHVNVIIAPKESVGRPQTREEIAFMLNGGGESPDAGPAYVVIKRVDYYFHEKVWTLDYAKPNVYAPRAEWQAEVDALPESRIDQRKVWAAVRERAYEDAAETVINTHIVGFIGADNKGTDQILAAPGGKNRDSHGTYPFRGLYKNVGPGGASEHITPVFDYLDYFAGPRPGMEDGRLGRTSVLRLDREDRVEIVPDWERVHDLMYTDPAVREQWSWLVLPIRWGYPAAESPFAGIISHASTGNLAPQTGSQNKGWNRAGAGSGFHEYDPHRYGGYFALGWQDGFKNTWGWLNATIPTLVAIPPFDLLFKVVGTPVAILTERSPTFLQAEEVPVRFMAFDAGVVVQDMDDDFTALLLNRDQVGEILDLLGYDLTDVGEIPVVSRSVESATSPFGRIGFTVGRRFTSENAFWAPRSDITGIVLDADSVEAALTSELKMWEWAGSLRFNITTNQVQPYAKIGYGVSWFRLENTAVEGQPLTTATTPTVSKFTWHWGAGVEWLLRADNAPPPAGIDIGLRAEWARFSHSLGLDELADPVTAALGQRSGDQSVRRDAFIFSVSLGF
jgi:uncharacterized membrane protein